jgi:cytochrome b6-f complex iron-sulfur subunit
MPEDVKRMGQSGPPGRGESHPTRRRFLDWLSRAFLGLWGLGAAGAIGAYLRPPEHGSGMAERTVRVGMLEDFEIGQAQLVRHGVSPFYVVRLDATRIVALSAVCTHVRCILGFDRERRALTCPCHDGRFDLAGQVLSGPPPRPLPSYSVSVRAGEVFVQL